MNKGAGLAVVAAVAVAAMRLSSGIASPAPQLHSEAAIHRTLPKKNTTSKPSLPGYVDGCDAYLPDPADKAGTPHTVAYPEQDEFGAAKSVVDNFFGPDFDKAFDKAAKTQPASLSNIQYAIALAPDPRHTNLSVMFDRQMVAIQQAAQDENYAYNSSWLPWALESQSYPLLGDQQLSSDLADRREACPGILLFRRSTDANGAPNSRDAYNNALVVLVVGEQPTGGINQSQWDNAIHWLTTHSSSSRNLRILGPTFSGSLVSLDRNLKQPSLTSSFASKNIQVLSGTVSSCSSILWFMKQGHPTFGTFQEIDELQIYRFLRYLGHHGTDPTDTVILSEDETAYGAPPTASLATKTPAPCNFTFNERTSTNRPLELAYPRDMSALRAEYQKESVFASSVPTGGHQVHSVLEDGAEPDDPNGQTSDTIPTYSGHVTPLAQEAVLYGIVSELRTHHSRYLLLRCTNPLDFLFLTRFFHRAYPEGRVVIVGQDLLFRREVDTTEFRGVMSLSNYPLLPRDEHWSRLTTDEGAKSSHAHRVFESHLAEGTYLAARYTFDPLARQPDPTSPITMDRKDALPGYADPFWLNSSPEGNIHAPTWLTVVGRDGFWPVAVLSDVTTPNGPTEHENETNTDVPAIAPPSSILVNLKPALPMTYIKTLGSLPLAWKVCSILAIVLVLYQAYGISRFKKIPSSGLLSVFRPGSAPSQHILLGISCVLAVMVLLVMASISIPLPNPSLLSNSSRLWELCVCELAPIFAIVFLLSPLSFKSQSTSLFVFLFSSVFLLLVRPYLHTVILKNSTAAVPLFYRMGHLTSGVSPLLPVIFLSAGFYVWVWQAMAGNLLLCKGRPFLPRLATESPLNGWRKLSDSFWCRLLDLRHQGEISTRTSLEPLHFRISHAIDKRIVLLASPLSAPFSIIVPPLSVGLAGLILFWGNLPLLSLEGRTFTAVINGALLLAFLLTMAETCRLFWTWNELRRLLTALNRYRLRRTFARLRAVPSSSLWGMSGNVQRVQYLFFSQQLNAARRLTRLYPCELPCLENAVKYGRRFALDNAPELTAGPLWTKPVRLAPNDDVVFIREVLADAVAEVINKILIPRWSSEQTSLSLETSASAIDERERNIFDMKLSENPIVKTAEEFVCFHYIGFIQNILARMRSMVFSMISLFVAVCFAISFYPFVPRTQVSLWMMLNLVLITFTVIYVYAGMERDETLSYISNTKPGELSSEFWLKTAGFLAGPVIGILTTQFPSIADSVLGWLQPGLDAFK